MENPWQVENLQEFLYYCCPQCDLKVKDCQDFVQHALIEHQKAREILLKDDSKENFIVLREESTIESKEIIEEAIASEEDIPLEEVSKKVTKKSKSQNTSGEWQCYVCGEKNSVKSKVIDHVKENHYAKIKNSMYGPPRQHQCAECKIMYQSEDSLALHLCGEVPLSWTGKVRGQNIVRKCSHCELTFKRNYELLRHVAMKHKKEKQFACDQCDYKASIPFLLKKHKARLHSDTRERSHLCNQCGSMFMEKTQLWSHIAYIHGKTIEDTMCFSCGLHIRTKSGLAKHLKEVHNRDNNRTPSSDPEKPFKCELCLKEFGVMSEIRKHFREDHKIASKDTKQEPKYNCSECSRVFWTNNSLESHFNRVHAKERKYPCPRCHEAFLTPEV